VTGNDNNGIYMAVVPGNLGKSLWFNVTCDEAIRGHRDDGSVI